jgi:hypothetical protein
VPWPEGHGIGQAEHRFELDRRGVVVQVAGGGPGGEGFAQAGQDAVGGGDRRFAGASLVHGEHWLGDTGTARDLGLGQPCLSASHTQEHSGVHNHDNIGSVQSPVGRWLDQVTVNPPSTNNVCPVT